MAHYGKKRTGNRDRHRSQEPSKLTPAAQRRAARPEAERKATLKRRKKG